MYTEFYNLTAKPFQISSDPAFMWFGEKHKEALATLQYGILDNKGFLLLTGDVGTGKTSLINSLLQNLSEDVICTSVPDPSLDKLDFFNYIAAAFGMEREFNSKGSFLAHFRNFLLQAYKNKKKVLLIIDEAQLLTQEMLEEIRLLSNIEKTDAKLINIFFIGQNEFNEILNRPQNRAVRQRMTLNYNLEPLTPEETDAYIHHRLKVAGTEERLFDHSAVQEIYLYSGGFPRRINILCDHALLSGYVKEHRFIDAAIISECAKELKIPAYVRNRDINGFAQPKPNPMTYPETSIEKPKPATVQQPPSPVEAPIPQPGARFPWTGFLMFVSVLLLIWVFMFPDHFNSTLSAIKQRSRISLAILTGKPIPGEIAPKETRPPTPLKSGKQASLPSPNQQALPAQTLNSAPPASSPEEEGETDQKAGSESVETEVAPVSETEQSLSKIVVEKEIPQFPEVPEPVIPIAQDIPPPQKPQPLWADVPRLPKETVVIRFQYNTNDFTEKGLEELERFSKALAVHPEARVRITGHTDSQGYDKYNMKLSEFRANIVKSYLMGKGVKDHQMKIQGMGGKHPIETNNTAWGRKMNRRVEIIVIDAALTNSQ